MILAGPATQREQQASRSTTQVLETRLCSVDRERERWDAYVEKHPLGNYCLLSGWKAVIERTYRHQGLYLWALEDGDVRGVLPIVVMRSIVFGTTMVSLPFLDHGGVCADDETVAQELLEACKALSQQVGAQVVELRHSDSSPLTLPIHGSKVMMRLPLQSDPEKLWVGFDGKLRNQIRKAMKSGLSIEWAGVDAFPEFYRVFAPNMRDLGSPVHSQTFFLEMFREFPRNVRLLLVKKEGLTIGAAFGIIFRHTFSIPWASSLVAYRSLCPNNLMYWEAIRWSCEQGFHWFDFGRSTRGAGTYHFKKQWGPREDVLHWQYVGRREKSSLIHSGDKKSEWMKNIWRRLPLSMANVVGPILRGHLSN